MRDGELEVATDALVDEFRDFAALAQRTAKRLLNKMILRMPYCRSRSSSKVNVMAGCAVRRISAKVEVFAAKRKRRFRGRWWLKPGATLGGPQRSGTGSSNPASSSRESTNFRFLGRGESSTKVNAAVGAADRREVKR